jgi:hypothetical protein
MIREERASAFQKFKPRRIYVPAGAPGTRRFKAQGTRLIPPRFFRIHDKRKDLFQRGLFLEEFKKRLLLAEEIYL